MASVLHASLCRRLVPCFLAASAGVGIASCGVDDRVLSSGGGSSAGLDSAVAHFALASCDRFRVCLPTFIRSVTGTYDECVERTKLLNLWIGKLPGVLQSPEFFMACAAAWNDLPCEEVLSPTPPAACKQYGSRALGEQCNVSEQCSSGFCKQTGYECGTCAQQPTPASSCQSNQDCGDILRCMSDHTCRPVSGLNESCSDTIPCQSDLTCASGSCVAGPATNGASCDSSTGLECDFYGKGLYCTSAGTCAPANAKAAGQSCADGGSYCEASGSCENGTCVTADDNGGACDNDTGPYCEWPARCASGACQLPTSAALCGGA